MTNKPLSRIPKNRKTKNKMKLTENQMQTEFINTNMDILHKYLLWKETILPSQILNNDVAVLAEDVEVEDITYYETTLGAEGLKELFKDNGLVPNGESGDSVINYGVINPNPEDPTRV